MARYVKPAVLTAPVHDAKAADLADAGVRAESRVKLVHRANGIESTVHFPPGTDLWAVLKRCDEWAKASST